MRLLAFAALTCLLASCACDRDCRKGEQQAHQNAAAGAQQAQADLEKAVAK